MYTAYMSLLLTGVILSFCGGVMHDDNFLRDICVLVLVIVGLLSLGAVLARMMMLYVPPFWRLLFL